MTASASVLFLAFAAQLRPVVQVEIHARTMPLTELLPGSQDGWVAQDVPVANTPEMKRAVAEWLNYDEAVLRYYRKQDDEISVYVAYWKPGKIHPRLISQHTPDICWPGAGWTVVRGEGTGTFRSVNGDYTLPAQIRLFSASEHQVEVAYWHLVGGLISDYTKGRESESIRFERTLWNDLKMGQREQYFIRFASNRPLSAIQKTTLVGQIVAALGVVGLTPSEGVGAHGSSLPK
jgi:hypothetical protein